MDLILLGLQGQELFVYIYDIVIYALLEEHVRKYNLLIDRLRKANLKLQPDKCNIPRARNQQGWIRPDPKRLGAVRHFPRSKTPKNIKQFLELTGLS